MQARTCGLRPGQVALQSLEAVEPDKGIRHYQDRIGCADSGHREYDVRRDPCEGLSDGPKPGGSKKRSGRLIRRTGRGLNQKLHVVADAKGRPIRMFLSAGQTSDHIGARALLSSIQPSGALPANRDFYSDWFGNALIERGILPRIPSRAAHKTPIPHDTGLCRLRHKIENILARLKDWRRAD